MASEKRALFYTGEWYCFDNFSAFSIEWRGQSWPTVEHAYQAAKYEDPTIREAIRLAPSPYVAKELGRDPRYTYLKRRDWYDVRVPIMEELLRAKRDQHEVVRQKLIESRDLALIEDSPTDNFWGRGPDWSGLNRLGELWMKLRKEP